MEKVYIVYEGEDIEGVFDNKEAANNFCKKLEDEAIKRSKEMGFSGLIGEHFGVSEWDVEEK